MANHGCPDYVWSDPGVLIELIPQLSLLAKKATAFHQNRGAENVRNQRGDS